MTEVHRHKGLPFLYYPWCDCEILSFTSFCYITMYSVNIMSNKSYLMLHDHFLNEFNIVKNNENILSNPVLHTSN